MNLRNDGKWLPEYKAS